MSYYTFALVQSYKNFELSVYGKAKNMLIRQSDFPLKMDHKTDKCTSYYLDRALGWDYDHTTSCLKKHLVTEYNVAERFREMKNEDLFNLLCSINKSERNDWTGYRVIAGVGGSGNPFFCIHLFCKGKNSKTIVYSGDQAPNVLQKW